MRLGDVQFTSSPDDVTRIAFRRTKTQTNERLVPLPDAWIVARLRLAVPAQAGASYQPFAKLSRDKCWFVHERARDAIGAPSLTIKDLRHVAAQLWRRSGADLETIREYLGHTSLSQTQIYAAFTDDGSTSLRIANRMREMLTTPE
jgi:integrase